MVEHLNTETVTPLWCLPDDDPAVPLRERQRRLNAFKAGRLPSLDTDCEQVKSFCETWQASGLYRDFATTWNAFCTDVLQVAPSWVDKICEGLRLLRADGQVGMITTAQALSRTERAQELASDPQLTPTMTRAEAGSLGGKKTKAFNDVKCSVGNSQEYLIKRLKRDAPEIATELAEGKYPSARAAAKAAGIVRDKTPLETLYTIWRKVPATDRLKFLIEMLTPDERRCINTGLLPDDEA